MIRVLIVDDHPVVRAGLAKLLSRAGMEIVGEGSTGEEGLRLAGELHPDVVIWDLAMPEGGLAGVARLKAALPTAKVLVVTVLGVQEMAAEAERAGADGILSKAASPEELLTSLRACLRGERVFPEAPALSPREQEILELLGQGLGNQEIAGRLGVSPKTVESHLEGLKEKLGSRSTTELRARALRRS